MVVMVVMAVMEHGAWYLWASGQLGIGASSCCYGGCYIMLPLFLVRITRRTRIICK